MNFINSAQAQSLPTQGPVIQRTIEDESTVTQPTPVPATAKAAHGVVYGLIGIMLIIAAIGIAYLYWVKPAGKSKK